MSVKISDLTAAGSAVGAMQIEVNHGGNSESITVTQIQAGLATLASPTFTGTPAAPTPTAADSSTKIATTAFVAGELTAKAPLASPTFTGTPAAPTAAGGTNTTQLATTAFVQSALPTVPTAAASSDVRTGTDTAKFVTSGALADSAAFQTLTDGTTIAWNMASGYNAKVTIAGNRTIGTPTNPKEGVTYTLQVIQDGTGNRTLTWPASTIFSFGKAGTPTLSTGAGLIDVFTLLCINATTPLFRVGYALGS